MTQSYLEKILRVLPIGELVGYCWVSTFLAFPEQNSSKITKHLITGTSETVSFVFSPISMFRSTSVSRNIEILGETKLTVSLGTRN